MPLRQALISGSQLAITPGAVFRCEAASCATLVVAGQASYAPDDQPVPWLSPELAYTARGGPGFSTGTSNSSPGLPDRATPRGCSGLSGLAAEVTAGLGFPAGQQDRG